MASSLKLVKKKLFGIILCEATHEAVQKIMPNGTLLLFFKRLSTAGVASDRMANGIALKLKVTRLHTSLSINSHRVSWFESVCHHTSMLRIDRNKTDWHIRIGTQHMHASGTMMHGIFFSQFFFPAKQNVTFPIDLTSLDKNEFVGTNDRSIHQRLDGAHGHGWLSYHMPAISWHGSS